MLPRRRGAGGARGELRQGEQQHSDGPEAPGAVGRDPRQRGRGLSALTPIGPFSPSCAAHGVEFPSAAGHAGPSPASLQLGSVSAFI